MATHTISMSRLYRKYRPRILRLMMSIKKVFEEEGFKMDDPCEMSDDEYQWWLTGGPADRDPDDPDDDRDFDITITIIESKVRDGEDDFGVSFSMGLTARGGEIIGGFTPYNYSDRVWVSRKDPDAVAERWELMEHGADPYEIVAVVQRHYAEKAVH